jgi:hypothetical protein
MFSVCANPECRKPFDHHYGRLLRFYNHRSAHDMQHCCVRHFWLCDACTQAYELEYRTGIGVVLAPRHMRFAVVPMQGTLRAAPNTVRKLSLPKSLRTTTCSPSNRAF